MVAETYVEMLKEKLEDISPFLRLDASAYTFLEAWTSSVHPLVG
jgi:hypothetical protein